MRQTGSCPAPGTSYSSTARTALARLGGLAADAGRDATVRLTALAARARSAPADIPPGQVPTAAELIRSIGKNQVPPEQGPQRRRSEPHRVSATAFALTAGQDSSIDLLSNGRVRRNPGAVHSETSGEYPPHLNFAWVQEPALDPRAPAPSS